MYVGGNLARIVAATSFGSPSTRQWSRSIPIIPHSVVKTKPIPLKRYFSLAYSASAYDLHVAGLLDEAFFPVSGLYGIFMSRPFLSFSMRQQTHCRSTASSYLAVQREIPENFALTLFPRKCQRISLNATKVNPVERATPVERVDRMAAAHFPIKPTHPSISSPRS